MEGQRVAEVVSRILKLGMPPANLLGSCIKMPRQTVCGARRQFGGITSAGYGLESILAEKDIFIVSAVLPLPPSRIIEGVTPMAPAYSRFCSLCYPFSVAADTGWDGLGHCSRLNR